MRPDRAEADEGDDIGADPTRLQRVCILGDLVRAIAVDADHDRGDTLGQPRQVEARPGIGRTDVAVGMGVGIDQARRDDHPPRIDHFPRGGAARSPDIDDAVAGQLDIADKGHAFRSGIDGAAVDHDIDARVARRGGNAPDESGQGEARHRGLLSGRR